MHANERAGEGQSRRFVTALTGTLDAACDAPRRIWDVDSGAVLVALGVLLERRELEALFLETLGEDQRSVREDVLLHEAVRLCALQCSFAEAVEGRLEARTRCARRGAASCPFAEMATLWLEARDDADGEQLAALLWSLGRDRRWVVRPLLDMVRGDIWVRALRLLGQPKAPPSSRTAPAL